MRAIFISYRRQDAEGQAGRLFDDLVERFGAEAVFMDVAAIEPGRDFRRAIEQHVGSCGVLLAVMGREWIGARNEAGDRRLDDPLDFVRLETASALKRDIPVIPVLVQGARMPRPDQLPGDLVELAYRNGVELTHARWESDVGVLCKALAAHVQPQAPVTPQPAAAVDKPGAAQGTNAAPPAAKRWRMPAALLAGVVVAATGVGVYFASGSRHEEAAADQQAAAEQAQPDEAETAQPAASQAADDPRVAEERARRLESERVAAETKAESDRQARAEEEEKARAARLASTRAENERSAEAENERRRAAEMRRAEERARLAARAAAARWTSRTFEAPNGGLLAYTVMPDGNPACASYDGTACLWGVAPDKLDLQRLQPLACGEAHRRRWNSTGYDDPKHWCSLVRNELAARRGRGGG